MNLRRTPGPEVLALTVLVALAFAGLCWGRFPLEVPDVLRILVGQGAAQENFVVWDLRLPRVLCALLVGALLAWSGTLFQALFRNPLVSPDFIGIETGASAAAVLALVLGVPSSWLAPAAFAGAAASALGIYALSWRGHLSGPRLILIGVGMNALLAAVVSFLLVRANVHQAAQAYQWMVGSLYSTTLAEAGFLGASALVFGALALVLVRPLRVLQVGDLGARSLGLRVEAFRLTAVLTACGLAASAVSVVGPIGFVALAVPHLARMTGGSLSARVLVQAGLFGGVLLLGVDLVGQHFIPLGLPAGLLAAALGGPYFLFLLSRRTLVS